MVKPAMMVAGMATMPSRAATIRIAVASALQLVDRLFLNRFEEMPDSARFLDDWGEPYWLDSWDTFTKSVRGEEFDRYRPRDS
jgi:hypothetical protein